MHPGYNIPYFDINDGKFDDINHGFPVQSTEIGLNVKQI
jgi:hypothetical protein